MQKGAKRILGALIVLIMVLSILPASVFATEDAEGVLKGWSITLSDEIGVKFHLNSADYTVTATVNGKEVTPTISDEGVVTVNVAAAQMTVPVVLTVKDGADTVYTGEYSVREYAVTILEGEYDDYVKDMVKQMLNYGAAAQEYFGYNTENLANAGYELESNAQVPTEEVPEIVESGSLEGIELYGMSLVLESKTAVRFYFTGNVSGHEFKVGDTKYTPVAKSGMHFVEIDGINPQDLANAITLNVDGTWSVTYSPLNYIVRMSNKEGSSDSMKSLVQALYGYHQEAVYYDKVVPVGDLKSSGNGWGEGGIYATMPENDAYFVQDDWGIEYTPDSADVIKLVRGGVTTSVGMPGQGTLIKFTATDYYLKTEGHTIGGDVLPLQNYDYLIVEGGFNHPATGSTMYISKTYIYNNNGTLEFSTTEPVLPVTYDVGVLQASAHGAGDSGIYFQTAEANDAPWGDWNTYYDSRSVDNIKLIRGGETISVGLTDRDTICKFGTNDYYLRLENYTIGDYAPFTTDDMFIVEGEFIHKDSNTILNIEKTYIYYNGSAWVFSATELVIETETESPFTFDSGLFSADIFNNRNNGLSVSVENRQLKLQQPEGASNWLWIKQDMPAGTVVTMDVTFSGDGMSIFGYGSKENGDPITDGTVTESVPQGWFWGQGGSTSGSYTFTIYEDCYGLSLMLGFANSTETAIYIDNVVITVPQVAETESPFTFDSGLFSADIFNNRNNGLSVSVENKQLKLQQPAGAANWLWIKQDMPAGTVVTMDVTFSGDGMSIFGYGSKENGDPITDGTVTEAVPQGWFWGQGGSTSGSYTFTIYEDCYGLSLMLGFADSTETAIYIDNVVITVPEATVINGGNLTEHADGWNAAGEIFVSMAENALPVDENAEVEYTAQSGVIKLVSGGNTSELTGTIVKYGPTDYYMVLSDGTLSLKNNDYLIVEGDFANADNGYTLNVAKTYILVDGDNLVYSTTEPVIVNKYEVGVLTSHDAGVAVGDNGIKGIYATCTATDATNNSDWSVEYTPVSAENYKLIRDGETYNVGVTGSGTLVMTGQTSMYLKQEGHTFGDGSLLPLQKGDVLVVEGNWSCNQDASSVINITPTYILITGEGSVKFLTAEPNIVKINVLKESQNARGDSGFYATADANAAPYNEWALRYVAQSVDAVKFVTGETTTDVANTSGEMLVKFTDYDYYFESWTLGDTYANIAEGDMYIVNGLFYNAANDIYLDIDTTYIKFIADDELFGATEPVVIPAYEVGVLASHSAGVNVDATAGIKGIYAVGTATEATYDADWNVDYAPVSSENIQLIRNGETYNVGAPGTRTLILFSQTDYYLDVHDGTITGSLLPLQEGDILVLEGEFSCNQDASSVINITTTYILIGDGTATFSATEPSTIPSAGVLTAHTAGGSSTAFYATGAENDAPYDWAAEYAPSSADCIKLIRNGETYSTGNTGAGTVVKFDTNGYYIKFEGWMNGNYPLQAGDIIIIEGIFVGTKNGEYTEAEGVQLKIDKTFVSYNGTGFTFSAEDPRVINVGPMYAQGGANWHTNPTLLNFALDANEAPSNSDWSVEYIPASNEAIKLIRNGETKNIANTGAGTIIKTSESNCILKLEQWMIGDVYPIREGDVLVVEGEFKNANNGYTMVIEKTYIVIGSVENDEVTFTTHYEVTDFGTVILPTSTEDMTIGMWNGSHHVFDHKQLQELQAAGITKIMGVNPLWIGTEDVNAWLDRVYSYGIRVIMDLRDWDGSTVPSYANHPGLIGFLMYDEPGAKVFGDLAALKAKFDAVMPADKLFYVNLFPECAADSSLGTESSWWDQITGNTKDYDTDYVTAFLNALDIEVLSWDNYPLITNSANATGIRTDYFHNFEVMASKNKPLWYTMLSAGHTAGASDTYYATPTAEELRWQMAVAMTYGVQNIDHYVYASHEDGYSCMVEYEDANGNGILWETTDLYDDILTVDNEYLAWDHIFMAYDWQGVGVYDTGSNNKMLTVLENKLNLANYGLTVTSNQNLLVGVFDHNGDKAYMVTNAGSAGSSKVGDGKNFTAADATVTLNLGSGSYKCAAVIDNGEISYVAVNNNTVTLNVQAYEGVFVIPVLN